MANNLDKMIDEDELTRLAEQYGDFTRRHVTIEMQSTSVRHYKRVNESRRGEIVFALTRPDGAVLLHTKYSYPNGLYRLPTGGIDWGEPVAKTFHREVQEETQLPVRDERFLGVLSYEFTDGQRAVPFVSYLFHAGGVEGEPVPEDDSEGIEDFCWIPQHELADVATTLRSLDEDEEGRHDWGVFRAVSHELLLGLLR
ncbi:MAG: NUDIX hydrolase [Planctomycetota bacterium]|nr:MAG: NUDIX hydrolase [Planctomycetota bacterium]REJ88291.1 MAG: NUDIX hydrolase [Planctomycetota bacterium]REK22938.1 MAG: NUDIX hydrolase [Planctomycetota bacterium]REK44741.1 MAG: NUDIX hydrolase [Planctomycetota bacterium]